MVSTSVIMDMILFLTLLGLVIYDWCVVELGYGNHDTPLKNAMNGLEAYNIFLPILVILFYVRISEPALEAIFKTDFGKYSRKIMTYWLEISVSFTVLPAAIYVLLDTYVIAPNNNECVVRFGEIDLTSKASFEDCTVQHAWATRTLWCVIISMYLFELILQGRELRQSLMAHHLAAIALLLVVIETTPNSAALALGWCHAITGILEQSTFIALFWYRVKPSSSWHSTNFFIGWTTFGFGKLLSHIGATYFYIAYFNTFVLVFKVLYPFFALAFLFAQIWSTLAQYRVWQKMKRKGASPAVEGNNDESNARTLARKATSVSPEELVSEKAEVTLNMV